MTVSPSKGVYNFANIDAAIAALPAGAKWSLSVSFGMHSPAWMSGQRVSFTFNGAPQTMPLPWDSTFLGDWKTIQSALAARYASHPALHHIVFGIQSITQETSLPSSVNWNALGYSKSVVEAAFNQMVSFLKAAWPNIPLCMDFVPGAMPDGAPDEGIAMMNLMPAGSYVQNNALSSYVNTDILKVPQCPHAYQMVGPLGSSVVSACKSAQANGSSFVEIYPNDVQYV